MRQLPSATYGRLAMRARLFFFSSRRRHTRSLRDWSSDVCSSDLFLAQQADESVERVFADFAAGTPDVREDFVARDDSPGVPGEKFHQAEFGERQVDFLARAKTAVRGEIQDEVMRFQDIFAAKLLAAHKGAHSCKEFDERKRLGEVIIGAGIEAFHDIAESIARR